MNTFNVEVNDVCFKENDRYSYDLQADSHSLAIDLLFEGICYRRIVIRIGKKKMEPVVKSSKWE